MNPWSILFGAALGAVFVVVAERLPNRGRLRLYAAGLVVASSVYVVFALVGSASAWLPTEIGGALLFTAAGVGGLRAHASVLAMGWGLHAGWDLLLHGGTATAFVPATYVALCVGFDFVVAGAILARTSMRDPMPPE